MSTATVPTTATTVKNLITLAIAYAEAVEALDDANQACVWDSETDTYVGEADVESANQAACDAAVPLEDALAALGFVRPHLGAGGSEPADWRCEAVLPGEDRGDVLVDVTAVRNGARSYWRLFTNLDAFISVVAGAPGND